MGKQATRFKVGFVLDYILFSPDSTFIRKEDLSVRVDYVDRWLGRLSAAGVECVKYVPARYVRSTETIQHRLGHLIKLVPASSRYVPAAVAGRQFRLEALAFALNLRRELANDRVGILHYANYFSTEFALSPLISWRTPSVVWFSGGNFPRTLAGRWGWFFALWRALRRAKAVMIGEYPERQAALAWALGGDLTRVRRFQLLRVERGLFAPGRKDEAARVTGLPSNGLKVLCVLSSIPPLHRNPENRDPFTMVRLLKAAFDEAGLREVNLAIVGAGPGLAELQRVILRQGLEERTRILSPLPHESLPAYYGWADLVFLPMRLEALNEGYVLAEAFACGRPVAAFRRNGSVPVDQPGGFLVDKEPSLGGKQLADALTREGGLEEKGREALEASARFDEASAAADLLRIYREAVSGQRAARR